MAIVSSDAFLQNRVQVLKKQQHYFGTLDTNFLQARAVDTGVWEVHFESERNKQKW